MYECLLPFIITPLSCVGVDLRTRELLKLLQKYMGKIWIMEVDFQGLEDTLCSYYEPRILGHGHWPYLVLTILADSRVHESASALTASS